MDNKKCPKCKFIKSITEFNHNSSKCKSCAKEYYIQNKERIKNQNKVYRQNNNRSDYSTNYYFANKERLNEQAAKNHKKWYARQSRKLLNNRRGLYLQNNPKALIAERCRNRIRIALRMAKVSKKLGSKELLGCEYEVARQHIEKLFKPGMTWQNNNYRGWHIDHIIPCSKFDLTKIEEQKKCFHYTNLQPLWWKDNFHKGAN